ncbi:hypothetical protein HYV82_05955 [Candidatus Woesearchaeota archaeon]|nr:hypothetical protein [Candidatus Woesearchaeota archaeon]
MAKKAQAAMEFLMTYGWAILVVLVVIGALAYFGVLSPDTLLPEKCTLPILLNCKDHKVTDTSVTDTIMLSILNGAGRDMRIYGINLTSDAISSTGGICSTGTISVDLANGDTAAFTADKDSPPTAAKCVLADTGRSKNRYKIQVTYSWLDSTSTTHTLDGELLAKSEKG